MQSFSEFLIENTNTYQFYHGGNLDITTQGTLSPSDLTKVPKSKRIEYGPGLYLTTSSQVVEKYAKGSRKVYLLSVQKGNDISKVKIDFDKIDELSSTIGKSKTKLLKNKLEERFVENGKVPAYVVLNILLNESLLKTEKARKGIKDFLVASGVDYELHQSPFGWGESMMVLFNLSLIKNAKVIDRKEVVKDLPRVK